jgi:hypothetical protein
MTERRNLKLKNDLDCPGSRRFPAAGFMPLIDSAEKFITLGLNCQDNFAVVGCVVDGVTPLISGLADFIEDMICGP